MFWELYGDIIIDALIGLATTALTAVAGYLGLKLKKHLEKQEAEKTTAKVVKTVVRAVEQMYKDLHGEQKLEKAIESASEILASKGIMITELELRMLIEDTVGAFNDTFHNKETTTEVENDEVAV